MLTSCTYSLTGDDASDIPSSSAESDAQPKSSLPPAETSVPEVESVPPEMPEAPVRPAISAQYEDIASLDAEAVQWGPGVRLDKDGRPEAPVMLQEEYGKYGAYFIAPDNGKIYLTFDEGYENSYTPSILDTLKEKGVSAAFFVTYPYAKGNPALVQRMIDEGHAVGNHSTTHPSMPTKTLDECKTEIMTLHDYVLQNFGYEMWLFRPPEGAFSEQTLALTHSLGYLSVLWSFAYKDWDINNQMGYDGALAAVTKSPHSGGIYLLHAVSKDNAAILGDVIDKLRAEGYELSPFTLAGEKNAAGTASSKEAEDAVIEE
ncbi:MAG: polysaccharide deacetylase family protein [Acetanaerobacterium sp.]